MKPLAATGLLSCLAALVSAAVPNQDGLLGANKTHAAQTLSKGHLLVSGYSQLINDDGVFDKGVITRGGRTERLRSVLEADGYFSADYGITNSLEAALDFPAYYEKVGTDSDQAGSISPGEVKVFLKYRLPFGDPKKGFTTALLAGASGPTSPPGEGILPRELEYVPRSAAATKDGSRAFGTGTPELYVTAILSGVFGNARNALPWSWHLNAGIRKPMGGGDFDDVFVLSTAAEYRFDAYFEMFCEFHHETGLSRIAGTDQWKFDPTTLSFSGVASTSYGLTLQAGISIGLLQGGSTPVTHVGASGDSLESFGLKGAPPVALKAGLSWNFLVGNSDEDRDGIPDRKDRCPLEPEDKDGYQDDDGCPEPDNDGDGVLDALDKCPTEAEDRDGFQDDDGCPDPDNDKDGVLDSADKCPMEPGPAISDGCVDHDTDKDGIQNDVDKCPMEAEDRDGFQDSDGCPDPDNDKDGIPDGLDKCPNQPETKNGYKDDDGCPDQKLKVGERLVLNGVFFKTNSAELTTESYTALNQLTEELEMSPEVRMQVLGHTDNVGSADANRRLSADRARSVVEYLVGKGIAKDRLKYIGYGPDQPIGDNKTAAGREVNRRVELLRLED